MDVFKNLMEELQNILSRESFEKIRDIMNNTI